MSGIPSPEHGRQVKELRDQLRDYERGQAGFIEFIGGGGEAKLLISPTESERHPDLSIYTTPAPDIGDDVWSYWKPKIVVEGVGESSRQRDYNDRPADYFSFGVDEYWIIDAKKGTMTVHRAWRGEWDTRFIKPTTKYTTLHLRGFKLDLKRIFAAAKKK